MEKITYHSTGSQDVTRAVLSLLSVVLIDIVKYLSVRMETYSHFIMIEIEHLYKGLYKYHICVQHIAM